MTFRKFPIRLGGWLRLEGALGLIPLAGSVLYLAAYLFVALARMRYPFELEWMEGGAVQQVSWILAGHKLYVPPTFEFTPWVYPPLYFYASAALSSVLGGGFLPLRLLSFVASLGSLGLIFAIVRRETADWRAALLSVGLFAATFELGGGWFDLARTDSLFLALLLGALYLLRFSGSAPAAIVAGVLLSLSCFTKQTALVVGVPLALFSLAAHWRRGLWFTGTVVFLVVGGTLLLDQWQDGRFSYYVFTVPGHFTSRYRWDLAVNFWTRDVAMPLGAASALAVFYLLLCWPASARRGMFYLAVTAGMCAGSWIPRSQIGGFQNVLIPAHAAIALLFGLAVHEVRGLLQQADPSPRSRYGVLLQLLCVMQFVGLAYNPLKLVPTPRDLEVGRSIVDRFARVEGDVLVFHHGYLATLAGKSAMAHPMALLDVLNFGSKKDQRLLRYDMRDVMASKRFKAVVLDVEDSVMSRHALPDYEDVGPVTGDRKAFWPVTGWRIRPTFMFELRSGAR